MFHRQYPVIPYSYPTSPYSFPVNPYLVYVSGRPCPVLPPGACQYILNDEGYCELVCIQ